MFKEIFKTYRIASISRELDPNRLAKMMNQCNSETRKEIPEIKNKTEKALWDFVEGDRELKRLMDQYKASRAVLASIYERLVQYGAAQWVNDQLICASAFAHRPTLEYLLRHKNEMDLSKIVLTLVKYFEDGEEGEVNGFNGNDRV